MIAPGQLFATRPLGGGLDHHLATDSASLGGGLETQVGHPLPPPWMVYLRRSSITTIDQLIQMSWL